MLDHKLGSIVKEKLGINVVHGNGVHELARGVRAQLAALAAGLTAQELRPMSLGLSHSLSRYKLKFSPDKVDTMIVQVGRGHGGRVIGGGGRHMRTCTPAPPTPTHTLPPQAIGLLDDLDKELNTYAMRLREWYGWHFPEMTKIVNDNLMYAKTGERGGVGVSGGGGGGLRRGRWRCGGATMGNPPPTHPHNHLCARAQSS